MTNELVYLVGYMISFEWYMSLFSVAEFAISLDASPNRITKSFEFYNLTIQHLVIWEEYCRYTQFHVCYIIGLSACMVL